MTARVGEEEGGLPGRLFRGRAHLVSHTHWDREWYLPAGRFRQRLVALIDELLDAPVAEGAFLLDGQTVLLEDFLQVRPERASELSAQLREGRLEAGPWYVLADELIPSGEALVRNLLVGQQILRALRAEPPPVLYCPDSFGHPAALPAIAKGFGCELIILWRGFGSSRWPMSDVVRWQSPDGSEVTVYHLPPSGYEFGANLPADLAGAAERWAQLQSKLFHRSQSGVVLITNGADHHARQRDLEQAVRSLQAVASPHTVRRSSLRAFAAELISESAASAHPVVRGELRDSYGYTWTLQGTFASRAAQKRRNAHIERMLLRECEPLAALAALRGLDQRALLRTAWRTLLQCHPHDTLCGCSIDEVAAAMDARLADAEAQAGGLRSDALATIVGHDAAAAHERRDEWRPRCVIWNAAPRPRSGVAEVEIDTPLYRVPVGPGSEAAPPPRIRRRPISLGADVPLQVLSRDSVVLRTESPRHYPVAEMCERTKALAWVGSVSGCGTISYSTNGPRSRASVPAPVRASGLSLDNGVIRLSVDALGGVHIDQLISGRGIHSAIAFEDIGDGGDLYTHSPVGDASRAEFVDARLVHDGPLRGEIFMRWRLTVPRARVANGPNRRAVRAPRARLAITTSLSLDAGAQFVRVRVRGENSARDHRLRIVFRTGLGDAAVYADAAFGTVRREAITVPPEEARVELPPPTAPLHRYVSLFTKQQGVTVFSDGLAEYEATPEGDVAVTLVRAVGQLSRNDLPERPGHAGWPADTPAAQCMGAFEATFAVLLHDSRSAESIDLIERTSDDVLLPLRGTTLRSAIDVVPATSGFELNGTGLAFSAIKASEHGRGVTLRCVNLTEDAVQGSWQLPVPFSTAHMARLDETRADSAPLMRDTIAITVPPLAVVTAVAEP